MSPHPLPRLRLLAVVWLAVYLPSYTHAYGVLNFLFLCNLGIMLTAIGLWRPNALLLSSQALACPMISLAWTLDAGARLLAGAHLFGFTAYMWDPRWPLFTRLLSLYHVAWPFVVFWALRRLGYDRRALALQAAIASLAIAGGRLAAVELNINFAWADPLLGRGWGPGPLHVTAMAGLLVSLVYLPTHRLLRHLYAAPGAAPER